MAMVSACAMQRSAASSARAGVRCSTRLAAPRPVLASKRKGRSSSVQVSAILGGGPETDKPPAKKLLREEEPEEYWSAASEKAGANPMKDPVAIIGVVAILFPFVFVAIAIATGAIDISVYK